MFKSTRPKSFSSPTTASQKKIATLTDDDFQEMNSGEGLNLVELNRHKKFGKILSPFRIFVDENSSITLSEPVEQFDFAVLCVAISESPLWQIAYLKSQFMTFDVELLNVPNQNKSKMNIELKN